MKAKRLVPMRPLVLAMALLPGGLAFAQAPAPAAAGMPASPAAHPDMHGPGEGGPEHGGFLEPDKLATLLDLTPAQAGKVKGILDQERERMRQLHEQHMRQMDKMMEEMHSTHEKVREETLHQLGAVLSAPQLKKFEILMDSMRGHGGPPHGMGPHGMHHHEMGPHGMEHGPAQPPATPGASS